VKFAATSLGESFPLSSSLTDRIADPTRLATEGVWMGDQWASSRKARTVYWRRGHGARRGKGVRLGLPEGSQQQICCFLLNSNNQCLQSIYPLLKIL
jgi:hypothetical protein